MDVCAYAWCVLCVCVHTPRNQRQCGVDKTTWPYRYIFDSSGNVCNFQSLEVIIRHKWKQDKLEKTKLTIVTAS